MLVLAEFHWGWLLAAGILGLLMGWVGVVQRGGGLSKRGLKCGPLVASRNGRAGCSVALGCRVVAAGGAAVAAGAKPGVDAHACPPFARHSAMARWRMTNSL